MATWLGVEVVGSEDPPPLRRGQYERRHRRITLSSRLDGRQLIDTLGHEIAHALLDDACSTPAVEARARMLGAALTAACRMQATMGPLSTAGAEECA